MSGAMLENRWSMKRPAIRAAMLLPAGLSVGVPAVLRLLDHDLRVAALATIAPLLVAAVVGYGLLAWKIVMEAHRRSRIGGLFGEER